MRIRAVLLPAFLAGVACTNSQTEFSGMTETFVVHSSACTAEPGKAVSNLCTFVSYGQTNWSCVGDSAVTTTSSTPCAAGITSGTSCGLTDTTCEIAATGTAADDAATAADAFVADGGADSDASGTPNMVCTCTHLPVGSAPMNVFQLGGNFSAIAGEVGKGLSPEATLNATAVALTFQSPLAGQSSTGYWIVPLNSQVEDGNDIYSTASISYDISQFVEPGTYQVQMVAVDQAGNFGSAVAMQELTIASSAPTTQMFVQLHWDTPSDLDLQLFYIPASSAGNASADAAADSAEVGTQGGCLVNSDCATIDKNMSCSNGQCGYFMSLKRPVDAASARHAANLSGPYAELVRDSLAGCVDDGLRTEYIEFENGDPAPGEYQIWVNMFDNCKQAGATYQLDWVYNGVPFRSTAGTIGASDVLYSPTSDGKQLGFRWGLLADDYHF